jgi:hypothetical protein
MSKGDAELAALVAALDLTQDEEIELGALVGKIRARKERAVRDRQAAELLPLGAEVVAIRQGCHRSTVYRRALRVAQKNSRATSAE